MKYKMEEQSVSIYTEDQWNTPKLSMKFYFIININAIFTGSLLESITHTHTHTQTHTHTHTYIYIYVCVCVRV